MNALSLDGSARSRADASPPALIGALQTAILNSANFSSIATDEKGVIQIFNVGAERMLGYAAADVLNQITPAEISDPQELIARAAALSRELSTLITPGFEALVFKASRGIEDIYELTYLRKDGTRLPAIVSVTALRDDAGAVIGYLLIGTDNTARKQVEAEQQKLDQRLRDQQFYTRSLIESNINALIATDPAGTITDVNAQTEALTGCTREQLIGTLFKSYFTDQERAEAAIKLVLSEQRVRDYELTTRARDGKETVVSYNATTFYDRDGKLQGVFAAASDITERKRLDLVLQDKNVELESARLTAVTANLAKSDFLSSMSHELRSPLNAILGFAQLMDSDLPPPTRAQKASIEQILSAGWYLLELINEILDLAVIESGKLSVSEEPVSLADVLAECRDMVEAQAQKRTVTLSFPTFDGAPFVLCDRTRLKQVLMNLLTNAIKYNRRGGSVTVECAATELGHTCIRVRDTGAGLSPDQLRHLFEPFNRLGQQRGAEEGTGIGLVMSKRLIGLMSGQIGVESTVGIGSVFWFALPTVAAPFVKTQLAGRPPVTAAQASVNASPMTLLYVEDNPANLKLVEQLISRRADLRLLTAVNGTSGVELARAQQPDVILMDINLPGMSGVQALQLLRADPATARIPVLALSANAMPGDIKRGLEAGFLEYLTKPINVAEFFLALDAAFAFARSLTPVEADGASGAGEFSGLRALLAEDEEANRAVATAFLSRLGFLVDAACDGVQAVEMALKGDYACALMDVQMPGMNGLEATRLIRASANGARLPIVAMTANALSGDRERLLAAGMNDYVAKPIERGALLAALRRQVCRPGLHIGPDAADAPVQLSDSAASSSAIRSPVDLQAARERLGLTEAALGHLLVRFAEGLPHTLSLLGIAVAKGEHTAIRQHAHALSGAAATLCVDGLRTAAAALEAAGRDGDGPISELFAVVASEANAFLGSMPALPTQTPESAGPMPTRDELLRLSNSLSSGDLSEIQTGLTRLDHSGGGLIDQLRVLIGDYDYERASALIEEQR